MSEKYLEDFAVGQTYGSGRLTVDKDRIKAFKVRTTTKNQKGEAVQVLVGTLIVPRRPT